MSDISSTASLNAGTQTAVVRTTATTQAGPPVGATQTFAAASTPPATMGKPPSAAGSAGTALLALVLVIGLVLVLGKLAKKLPGVGVGGGRKGFRVVAALPLGPKDRAVVIEVGQTQLLLGIGADGPRLLHTLEVPLVEEEATPSSFAQALATKFRKTR